MPSIDNKKKTRQNKLLYIFLTAFFVSLITIIYLATAFTPEIDLGSTGESEYSQNRENNVDDSLSELQREEAVSKQTDGNEEDSEIETQLKRMKEEALAKQELEDTKEAESLKKAAHETIPEIEKPLPANPTYKRIDAPSPAKMAKVYVGRYNSFDEAIKIQDEMVQDSAASAPFIKNMGGYYVIQVGSFANKQTAQNVTESLIEKGYNARTVLE